MFTSKNSFAGADNNHRPLREREEAIIASLYNVQATVWQLRVQDPKDEPMSQICVGKACLSRIINFISMFLIFFIRMYI